jgi:hypothetical protein
MWDREITPIADQWWKTHTEVRSMVVERWFSFGHNYHFCFSDCDGGKLGGQGVENQLGSNL